MVSHHVSCYLSTTSAYLYVKLQGFSFPATMHWQTHLLITDYICYELVRLRAFQPVHDLVLY